jgi:hypothetical protein
MRTPMPEMICESISPEIIAQKRQSVSFNNQADRSNVYEDFYYHGIINVKSINNSHCALLLLDSRTKEVCWEEKNFNLSFLPKMVVQNSKRKSYIHVLLKMRMFYNFTEEVSVIVPIGERCCGHSSNTTDIHPEGSMLMKIFLKIYLNDTKLCWESTPLPSYKKIRSLGKTLRKNVLETIGRKFFIVKKLYQEHQKIAS